MSFTSSQRAAKQQLCFKAGWDVFHFFTANVYHSTPKTPDRTDAVTGYHSSQRAAKQQLCSFKASGGFFGAALVAAAEGGAPAHHLTVGYALGAR
jgi:hypothetical protein